MPAVFQTPRMHGFGVVGPDEVLGDRYAGAVGHWGDSIRAGPNSLRLAAWHNDASGKVENTLFAVFKLHSPRAQSIGVGGVGGRMALSSLKAHGAKWRKWFNTQRLWRESRRKMFPHQYQENILINFDAEARICNQPGTANSLKRHTGRQIWSERIRRPSLGK